MQFDRRKRTDTHFLCIKNAMIMPTIYGATVQFGHPGGPAIAETRTQEFADTQKRRPHRRDVQCEDIPYQSLRFIRRLYPYRGSETK